MSSFAILRFAKLKTKGEISASSSHMMRTRPTANADPARTASNRVLIGTSDPAGDVAAKLGNGPFRKNGVLAVEVLATASPEWFAAASKEQKKTWLAETRRFLEDTFGAENLAHVQLHVDETTPHVTGLIVPRDPTSGRLNAARWLDGSARLAKLQDGYADRLKSLGIVRGLEGSKAKHTTIKQFYGALQSDPPSPPLPAVEVPPAMIRESSREEWAEAQSKRLAKRQKPAVEKLKTQAARAVLAERKARAYQQTGEDMRAAANAARDLPLQEVAQRLGLERDRHDKSKWQDEAGRYSITINDSRWYDHRSGQGRGGAIDLAMHVLGTDFRGAVAWLGHNVSIDAASRAATAGAIRQAQQELRAAMVERPPFSPPEHVPAKAQQVESYLIGRGLEVERVRELMQAGSIRADGRGNAVFVTVDSEGRPRGAELKGTGKTAFAGLAAGSSREAGAFQITTGDGRDLVLVESAIDAISYAQLHRGGNARIVSTSGARGTLPKHLEEAAKTAREVVVAYDADEAGQTAASRLYELLAGLARQVRSCFPMWGKDWNDQVRQLAKDEEERQAWKAKEAAEAAQKLAQAPTPPLSEKIARAPEAPALEEPSGSSPFRRR